MTGASGFLGQVIINNLLKGNHDICSVGRSNNAGLKIDLRESFSLTESFDVVLHAAGKAHSIPNTSDEVKAFWDVNVLGTQNLLKALEQHPPKRFVFISSVSVYGKIKGHLLNEDSQLMAIDPYGHSKIRAELEIINWCNRFNVIYTILRLPLIFGENPPGNLKAMINGIKRGYYFNISGGVARKSIVRGEDVAHFILPASEVGGIYNLTDGMHPNFYELSYYISKLIGRNSNIWNLPFCLAKFLAKFGDILGPKFPFNSVKLVKITSELTFDDSKARQSFGWNPTPVIHIFPELKKY